MPSELRRDSRVTPPKTALGIVVAADHDEKPDGGVYCNAPARSRNVKTVAAAAPVLATSVIGHAVAVNAEPPVPAAGLPAVELAPNHEPLFLFHHKRLLTAS